MNPQKTISVLLIVFMVSVAVSVPSEAASARTLKSIVRLLKNIDIVPVVQFFKKHREA